MKYIQTISKVFAVLAIVTLAACTSTKSREDLAVAAGFKLITPSNATQKSILTTLPAGKISPVAYKGKTYYVLPDQKNSQAYVGGPKQYQSYQQLRLAKQLSNQNLEAAQMNQAASMDWNSWGGWGAWGGYGWY